MTNRQESEEVLGWFGSWRESAKKRKKAEAIPPVESLVGWILEFGWRGEREEKGVLLDDAEEVKWYRKAAEQGHVEAQDWLGMMYWEDDILRGGDDRYFGQNNEEAAKWLRKSDPKDGMTQSIIGNIYYQGDGVPKDNVEAAKWFRKAAEDGDPCLQSWMQGNLGEIYLSGEGVPKDGVEAYAWLLLAEENGQHGVEYEKEISDLEERLTAEQRKKGRARAAELRRLIKEREENPKPSVESP